MPYNETIQIALLYSLGFNVILAILGLALWIEVRSLRASIRKTRDLTSELRTPFMHGDEVRLL